MLSILKTSHCDFKRLLAGKYVIRQRIEQKYNTKKSEQ